MGVRRTGRASDKRGDTPELSRTIPKGDTPRTERRFGIERSFCLVQFSSKPKVEHLHKGSQIEVIPCRHLIARLLARCARGSA